MFDRLMQLLDSLLATHQRNWSPITRNVAYEAGYRAGVVNGIMLARQQVLSFVADANEQDAEL